MPTPKSTIAEPQGGPAPSFTRLLALTTPERRIHDVDGDLGVYEADGVRWISSSNGAIQSAMSLADPAALMLPNHRAMLLAAVLTPRIGSFLDLGLGGGALTRHLALHWPRADGVAVEHSSQMLTVARDFFPLPDRVTLVVGDAVEYLRGTSRRFSTMFVDLFDGRRAPRALSAIGFYQLLCDALEPAGTLALNTLPETEGELRGILRAAAQVFPGVGIIQFAELGNVLLLLSKRPIPDGDAMAALLDQSSYAGATALYASAQSLHRMNIAAAPASS